MRQVAEGVAVALALFVLAAQQAVQRVGQAQQLARMLLAQALALAGFDLVQLGTQPAHRPEAPGQTQPEQPEQDQQGAAEPQVELLAEPLEQALELADRLHGDDAVGRLLAAQQVDLDVEHEELLALRIAGGVEFVAAAVVARRVVDRLVGRRGGAPEQIAILVVDIAEDLGLRQVELLHRQVLGHHQAALLHPRRRDQGRHVGGQALLDGVLQGDAEGPLQGRQQRQHEQHRQGGGAEHQTDAQGTDHRQRSVNR